MNTALHRERRAATPILIRCYARQQWHFASPEERKVIRMGFTPGYYTQELRYMMAPLHLNPAGLQAHRAELDRCANQPRMGQETPLAREEA